MTEATKRDDTVGAILAIAAAVGLGLAVAVSRYAYLGGTNGLTVATIRGVVALAGLAAFCLLTRRELRLPFRLWAHCAGLGVLMSIMFYGNVGSVQYISVGLAALLFFTYPPIIVVISAALLRERVSAMKALAVVTAFVGLALMLGVSLESVDPRGVVLSLAASVCCAWNAVWLARKVSHLDAIVVTFHMATVAALVLICVSLVSGSLQLPTAPVGWAGTFGVVALQASSLPLYFVAIPKIGAMKSGMLTNVQPVVSIVAAFLLFGEVLNAVQLLGGALVLAGIWLMQWHDSRAARAQAAT